MSDIWLFQHVKVSEQMYYFYLGLLNYKKCHIYNNMESIPLLTLFWSFIILRNLANTLTSHATSLSIWKYAVLFA